MQTKEQAARFERRVAELYASDRQFAAAQPSPSVTAAARQPELRLPQIVSTVLEGYASRPALAQRAVEFVRDPQTGRRIARILPAFETITYAQLQTRVAAVSRAWIDLPVNPGDRVATLGFTSLDYTTIDLALMQLGAVAVPLQTNTPIDRIRPVLAEIEPTLIASSVAHLDEAVQAVLNGPPPARFVFSTFILRLTRIGRHLRSLPHVWRKQIAPRRSAHSPTTLDAEPARRRSKRVSGTGTVRWHYCFTHQEAPAHQKA